MDRQLLHVLAGDIPSVVLDGYSAVVNGLIAGVTVLGIVTADISAQASFGKANDSFSFRPLVIYVDVDAASLVTAVPTISIGTNSPTYNNILTSMVLTGLNTSGVQSVYLPSLGSSIANPGDSLAVNITMAGLTSLGGSLNLEVAVLGFFTT